MFVQLLVSLRMLSSRIGAMVFVRVRQHLLHADVYKLGSLQVLLLCKFGDILILTISGGTNRPDGGVQMLQVFYGSDRAANTAELVDRICRNAENGIVGQILIVPEQYSHETERELCLRGGDTISRYAEVLSFTRLAARAFSVCGGVCEEYLDENGRILTLYLAAQQVREQLKFYAAVMTKPDFLKQLGALMEELLTACISPDALHEAARRLEGRLAQKVTELALLYESYLSICKTGREDPVTRQMRLRDILDETDFLDGREVFLDGFSDFTALQLEILDAMLAHVSALHVSVMTGGAHQAASQTGNETAKRLRQLAARQEISCVCERVERKSSRAPEIQIWLDGLFFGGSGTQTAPQRVSLVQAASVQAACAYAARQVRDGVAGGLRYRDFTICLADEGTYRLPMQTLLARAKIPVYYAANAPLVQKPLVAALLSAMQAAERYEQGAMLAFLKSDLSPLDEEGCDLLERYVSYWDIHGARWEKPWQMHPRGLGQNLTPEDEELLKYLNGLREQAVTPLQTLRSALARAKTVDEQVRAVAAFWEDLDLAGRLQSQQQTLETAGQAQQAQECGQIYEALLSALEQMSQVLGRASLDTELFGQLFSMLLTNTSVGSIPSVCDAVQLATLPMLRHRQSRVLLVLGAEDGVLPAFSDTAGLLADAERQTLSRLGVPLDPGRHAAVERELSWVCAAFSAAEEQVSLVSATAQPSFLFSRTKTLFPALQLEQAHEGLFLPDDKAAAGAALQQPSLPDWLPPSVREQAQKLDAMRAYAVTPMQPETVHALYGKTLPLSASKIDRYAGCRYAFFLQYGLQAQPWRQAEFDAPLFGSFVHEVLEHVVREAQAQGGFSGMTDEQVLTLAERCMDACMQRWLPQGEDEASRERYLSERNRREASAIVLDVANELRKSQFVPVAQELKFAPGAALPPIVYHAKTGNGLLTGLIDRVDAYEAAGKTWVRIVDYKTGHKDFDYTELLYGQNLQMLLYLFALQARQKQTGKPISPAGVLYVPGRCDMIRLEAGEPASEADAERRKQLRRKGLVINDETILQAMEAYENQPQYLPVKIKKDGLSGDMVSPAQFALLERFVTGQVETMIDELLSGATAPNPVVRGPADSACQYCDYAAVCHRDLCGCAARRFAAVKPEEFWQEVERRLQHE